MKIWPTLTSANIQKNGTCSMMRYFRLFIYVQMYFDIADTQMDIKSNLNF